VNILLEKPSQIHVHYFRLVTPICRLQTISLIRPSRHSSVRRRRLFYCSFSRSHFHFHAARLYIIAILELLFNLVRAVAA
jgi:hypothetical protein